MSNVAQAQAAAAQLAGTESHRGWWRAPHLLIWHLLTNSCCNKGLGAVQKLCEGDSVKTWAGNHEGVRSGCCDAQVERSHAKGTGMSGGKCVR